MGQTDAVLFDVDDGIATITINRPAQRNALSIEVGNRLLDLWERVDADPAIRVAILTSSDCGTFCAGMDLKEASRVQAESNMDILDLFRDPFHQRMRAVEKPIIAAMTGHFTAGGMVLAANCDLRIGLAGTLGGISEARVGRGAPWAVPMLWMLPQPFLMELMMSAELQPIERFRELGFINHVEATPAAVRDRARKLAKSIRDNAPLTVWAAKQSIGAAMDLGCKEGFEAAKRIHERVYHSQDAIEGPRAFAEKRAPRWSGT
ncbi:enoyl-CoA hydratase/isomerase family protein [Parapusillimonas granuli]|uniref:Enoyl-CoA hydratase/isomerase family protein n=1 Tax=Parapusillimonas granuli TaxID=380911 RepID=A0A853FWQ7_9BURK|nr:enoyl-CoA hydratase-related protein [Parapusillimonas granuli]MBB5214559.1 enoyl-CoA hydratase/carnithine racemase [Parapusillimonas granuli]NYT49033.1 enoyl-CoA hydratase/isomerase family protein [Parapusillimonas granuli]